MDHLKRHLENSLYTGFIDKDHYHSSPFKPELLVNERVKRQDVLTALLDELKICKKFRFAVAFITESGLATLKSTLYDLNRKGIRGEIITSTYQLFNQPKMFKELLKISNVDVKIADVNAFHSKGYIFQHEGYYSLIVGSSNLTAGALKTNYEWNIKLTSHENGEIVQHFFNRFETMWNESIPLTLEWIKAYENVYRPMIRDRVAEFPSMHDFNQVKRDLEIKPNNMQRSALDGIEAVRQQGHQRALVVSATGTGKTYLAAFDVRRYEPKRMLFVVHREQILKKAKTDFHRVIGGNIEDFGILSGTSRADDAKYVFATIQTISKDETLYQFAQETFDYILIDESHRAGANTYQKLLEYFTPKFLLGMTATPERSDGYDLFRLFDYNIAYEIRLQEALEENMLCPFHYFGVTDLEIDGEQKEIEVFQKLVSNERIDRIIEKINYYGYSGEALRGLMFCSSKKEAIYLSEQLNARGFRTCALTGDDTQAKRKQEVNNLEQGLLDYILTVDIFNEGIDIPSINQVVMLRQTESSIIFIQQLGRGLRKHQSKRYVTVIDFIANYKNNYLIPIALSDDRSQNKDSIRRKVIDQSYISGTSTINFEAVAKERIYESINQARLTDLKTLKEAYQNLKNRLGRQPMLTDFIENHSMDPVVIATKNGHYGAFLRVVESEVPSLSKEEEQILLMATQELLSGKRIHEIYLLKLLASDLSISKLNFINYLHDHQVRVDDATLKSVENVLSLNFFNDADRKKYGNKPYVELDHDMYRLPSHLQTMLQNEWFAKLLNDLLEASILRSKRYNQTKPLTRLEKYTRKDVCRLLNWEKEEQSTMYGYKVKHHTCPIFVTYHKSEDIEASVNYGDSFISPEVFHWYTRSRRTTKSEEVRKIIDSERENIDIHLFVKKDDDEGGDFYYLGEVKPDQQSIQNTTMLNKNGQELPVVTMNLMLKESVDQQIYDYLHEKTH